MTADPLGSIRYRGNLELRSTKRRPRRQGNVEKYSLATMLRPERVASTRGEQMPVHAVRMTLPSGIIVNSDVEFEITSNGAKLGELHLSKGSIDWRPSRSKKTEHRVTWEAFAELMESVPPKKL